MTWLLASVGVVVFGAAIAWLLLGPVSGRLARPYMTASTTSNDDLESLTKIRGTILQAAQGVVVVGGVLFTAGTLLYTARSVDLTRDTLNATRDGQVTDRYAKAVEELGSNSIDVRIGGIFALERIGEDSPHDNLTVTRVLQAFVLRHGQQASTPDDVSAALFALLESRLGVIHLEGAHLAGLDGRSIRSFAPKTDPKQEGALGVSMKGADLTGANLSNVEMVSIDLTEAHLSKANMRSAWLNEASLRQADCSGANLYNLVAQRADFTSADLADVNLRAADLEHTRLDHADLRGADLTDAELSDASLQGANLQGAKLRDTVLTHANLKGARMPDGHIHP